MEKIITVEQKRVFKDLLQQPQEVCRPTIRRSAAAEINDELTMLREGIGKQFIDMVRTGVEAAIMKQLEILGLPPTQKTAKRITKIEHSLKCWSYVLDNGQETQRLLVTVDIDSIGHIFLRQP